MTWFWIALALMAVCVAVTLALPAPRRVWAFGFYAAKYVGLWLGDVTRIRPLLRKLSGRPYRRLTRPVAMRRFCEDMGPTFIKFGQIVASSSGMFPERYVVEFRKCLDRVREFPFADVQLILASELGGRCERLTRVDAKPLASASIAQVHTAELDGEREVVVKVQRPGIQARVAADMRVMRLVAGIAQRFIKDAELANPVGVVEDFAQTLFEELDFQKEAGNLERFNEIMAELDHPDVRAPAPEWSLTTDKVMVMERFIGTRVDHAEEIVARGVDAEGALVKGLRAWFQCVIFYGFFHGDVHAGNLMLLDNEDLGFLDFGIVGRFDDDKRHLVTDWIVALSTGDFKGLARVIGDMGGVSADLDFDAFADDLKGAYGPLLTTKFGDLNYADLIPQIHRVARKHRMRMPKEFVLITKQMLYFDRYAKLLAPDLNIFSDPRLILSLLGDIQQARAQRAAAQ